MSKKGQTHQSISTWQPIEAIVRRCSVKNCSYSPFFNKVAGLRTVTLLKKRLWHKCFPVNFAKFLRTPLLTKKPTVAASEPNTYTKNHAEFMNKGIKYETKDIVLEDRLRTFKNR